MFDALRSMFAGKPESHQHTTFPTDHTPPPDQGEAKYWADMYRLAIRREKYKDEALAEIERLPFRSRRAQEIARAARMARPGDYFKAKAQPPQPAPAPAPAAAE